MSSSIIKKPPHLFRCDECGTPLIIKTSTPLSETIRNQYMKCTACNATFNCFITPKDFIHKNDQFTEPDANQQPELLCAKQRHLNLVKKETQMEKGSKEQPKKKTDNLQSSRYRQDEIEEIERWNRPSASTLNTIFK